mmetsp:Transcript_19463/g.54166  ORF Transcript_19463/g.54166 Transcript_19463/m.54166 type:complete len:236 (-) Transcript_19463:1007-1714(-)
MGCSLACPTQYAHPAILIWVVVQAHNAQAWGCNVHACVSVVAEVRQLIVLVCRSDAHHVWRGVGKHRLIAEGTGVKLVLWLILIAAIVSRSSDYELPKGPSHADSPLQALGDGADVPPRMVLDVCLFLCGIEYRLHCVRFVAGSVIANEFQAHNSDVWCQPSDCHLIIGSGSHNPCDVSPVTIDVGYIAGAVNEVGTIFVIHDPVPVIVHAVLAVYLQGVLPQPVLQVWVVWVAA